MRIAANIFPCGMVDPEMRREFAADPAIGRQRVGAKNNASADALDIEIAQDELDDRAFGVGFAFRCSRPAIALGCDHHHLAARTSAPDRLIIIGIASQLCPLSTLSPQVRLIHFDNAAQQPILVFQHATDALPQEPSRLLSNTEMLAELTEEMPLLDAAIR